MKDTERKRERERKAFSSRELFIQSSSKNGRPLHNIFISHILLLLIVFQCSFNYCDKNYLSENTLSRAIKIIIILFLTIKLIPYGFSWNVYFGTFAIILENLLIKKVWRLWLKKFLQICLHIIFRKKSITASQPWDFAKLLAWENSKQQNSNGNCYFLSLKIVKSIS